MITANRMSEAPTLDLVRFAAAWQPPNRERSMLAFNRHALAQARRDNVPLIERQRYITIVSFNLDKLLEMYFADVLEALRILGGGRVAGSLDNIAASAHAIVEEQSRVVNDELMPALGRQGTPVPASVTNAPTNRTTNNSSL